MGPRIVVVGAGAVGGYVGGHLHRLGHDVTLLDFWPEHVEAIRRDGLRITGTTPAESVICHPPALHVTEAQGLARQPPVDIAIVSVKSYDTEWATMLIRQYLAPGGFVVSLQNCLNEEKIAAVVGWGRVVGTIASSISVNLWAPGQIKRTVPMGGAAHTVFRIGEPHGRITGRVRMLAEMIGGVDSAKATTNLWGERWSKLCLNGMRNGTSAATGMTSRQMDANDTIRRFCIRLGSEAVRIGHGARFPAREDRPPRPRAPGAGRRRRCRGVGRGGGGHDRRLQPARRGRGAPLDGPGHREGPAHRDRGDERLHLSPAARRSASRRRRSGRWSRPCAGSSTARWRHRRRC